MLNSKQFGLTAIALAIASTAYSEEIISSTGSNRITGAASEVVIRENMWYNPAHINTTAQQLSVHSGNAGGGVADIFGQRVGGHVRQGRTDLFWGMGMGDMLIGTRLGIMLDNESKLPSTTISGMPLYTAPYDDGTNIITLTADEFKEVDNSRNFSLDVGSVMMGGNLSVIGRVASSGSKEETVGKGSILTNLDAGNGGTSTGTEREEMDTLDSTNEKRFSLLVDGRYYLSESFYVVGGVGFVSRSEVETDRDNSRTTERDAGGTATRDESTFDETVNTTKDNTLSGTVGLGLIERRDQVTIRFEQSLTLTRQTISYEEETKDDRFVDHLDATNNTTNATGITSAEESSNLRIKLPMRASLEVAASDKWTWRAGITADLLDLILNKKEEDAKKLNDANDGYVLDYTATLVDGSTLTSPNGVTTQFGLAYEPVENLKLDMVFNRNFLTNGFLNNGLATRFSVTYLF